jgi:membrane-associated phospholipid phosphatase
LIANRDAIVGRWHSLRPAELHLPRGVEYPPNLKLWGPKERAEVIAFELSSRLGYSSDGESVCVHHLARKTEDEDGRPGGLAYQPLVDFKRPTPTQFAEQLEWVVNYADLRGDRAAEIIAQMGISEAFYSSIVALRPEHKPRTVELAVAAVRLGYNTVMRVKQGLACHRPHEHSAQIQPMIPPPPHSSLPSGHATEAFSFAFMLWSIIKELQHPVYKAEMWGEQLMRQASRIAVNRTVAGVHYPIDSVAGATLGLTLAHYFVARCKCGDDPYTAPPDCRKEAGYYSWCFDGTQFKGDFKWRHLLNIKNGEQTAATAEGGLRPYVAAGGWQKLWPDDCSPVLSWLWNEAKNEWAVPDECSK